MTPSDTNPTYYEILNLSPTALTTQEQTGGEPAAAALIKRAYRRALLNHHPDKKPHPPHHPHHPPPASPTTPTKIYTIDQISTAYATLSRRAQRQAYDTSLLLLRRQHQSQSAAAGGGGGGVAFQTGIETIDLDDLECDEGGDGGETEWYRSCRCGNPRGYYFTEANLGDAADLGELMVGCADCSLWLRVCFAVVEENEDDADDGDVRRQDGSSSGSGVKGGTSVGAEDGER